MDILQNRIQVVKIKDNWGPTRMCAVSIIVLCITNDCVSHCKSVQIIKFADDTTLISLITNRTIEGRCLHCLNGVVLNYMKLNVLKTKEMVFYFRRRKNSVSPLTINGQDIDNVQCFTFLGTTISATLKWDDNLRGIVKKSHQRLFFLRQL